MCAGTKVGVVTDEGADTGARVGIDKGVGTGTWGSAGAAAAGIAVGTRVGVGGGAGAGADIGTGVDSSAFAELDAGREGFVVGSGVAVAVADSPEVDTGGVIFFPAAPRPATSFATALITFALGSVPKGAMFETAPCLSNPASAKLGRGGAKEGSTHFSNKVLGLSLSADDLVFSDTELFGAGPNGLLYRERVGRGVGVFISKSPRCDRPPPFFQLRPQIQRD